MSKKRKKLTPLQTLEKRLEVIEINLAFLGADLEHLKEEHDKNWWYLLEQFSNIQDKVSVTHGSEPRDKPATGYQSSSFRLRKRSKDGGHNS